MPEELLARNRHMDRETLQEAIDNQRYYLEQAKLTGKPWCHCPKKPHQYSEYVLLNRSMCEILETFNHANRPRDGAWIESLARDMRNGSYLQTEESLGIDINGDLYQGQHRIAAVRVADIDVPLYVTFQVPVIARFVVDSGMKRPTGQKLALLLGKDVVKDKATSICKSMMLGVNRGKRVTDSEIADFLLKYNEVIKWVGHYLRKERSDVQAAIAKAALWYGMDKITPFCERFQKVEGFEAEDPVRATYKWVNSIKGRRTALPVKIYRRVLHGVICFVHDRPCINLIERKKDVFEWGPNYTIPAKPTFADEE